jgi:hypothetical protein
MGLTRGLTVASCLAVLLGGCVASGPEPTIGNASLAPSVANPGQPVTISYSFAGNPSDIAKVSVTGLPTGALAAGASDGVAASLPLPGAAGLLQTVDLTVPVPTRAGQYPLALRVATARGRIVTLPLGLLVVNQMPARLSDAAITPASQSVAACSGGTLAAQLSYTIESANGAAAVSEIRLLPTELASSGAVLPQGTPLDLRHPPALAPAPVTASVASFPVRPLVAAPAAPQQVASTVPVSRAGAVLSPSLRWDVASDRVTTPVEIPCTLPAPTNWRLPIVGIVGGAQATNRIAAEYRATP